MPETRTTPSNRHTFSSLFLLISAAMITIAVLTCPLPTQAQFDLMVWSLPVRLTAFVSHDPTVTADPWGGVHVFWVQGDELSGQGESGAPNLIYHTCYDGQTWTQPNDVIAGSYGTSYGFPYATCDARGTIHMTWVGDDGLYYSSAPALDASSARSWQPPQVLVRASVVGDSRILVDQKGILHVVFDQRVRGTNVMYLRSEDQGLSWSVPIEVSELVPNDSQVPDKVRMAIDGHGSIHVVWSENHLPEWISRRVLYARSGDGGTTWDHPQDLSDPSSTDDWDASIDIAIDSQDNIHVVWTCGVSPGRCYRTSRDGGGSWSNIERLFGELIGLSGWDAMAADPYGGVYWVGTLRYPHAVYFSSLTNGRWRDPPEQLIDEQSWGLLAQAHFPQLAIGQGNQLHIVMNEGDIGTVWYVGGRSSQPSVEPPPIPSPTAFPTPKPTSTEASPTPQPTSLAHIPGRLPPGPETAPTLEPTVWALVPVVLLLLMVGLLRDVFLRN